MSHILSQETASSKPILDFDNIPQELKDIPQWVCWKAELRKNGKIGKPPYNAKTGYQTSHAEKHRHEWATFKNAVEAFEHGTHHFSGIGFMFSEKDPFCCIDLDDCVDEHGILTQEAKEILSRFPSYAEYSQSRKGIHIIIKAKLPSVGKDDAGNDEFKGRNRNGKEIYDHVRFLVFTGFHIPETPQTIVDCQEQAEEFFNSFEDKKEEIPRKEERREKQIYSVEMDDETLIERATQASNGDKFSKLFAGDCSDYIKTKGTEKGKPDHSAGDMAFLNHLAFWTGKDPIQMDRIFRKSGLYRPKWEREDYREDVISKALNGCTEIYSGQNGKEKGKPFKEVDRSGAFLASKEISAEEERTSDLEAIPQKIDIPLPLEKIHPIFVEYFAEFEGKTEAPMEYILSTFLVSLGVAMGNNVTLPAGLHSIKANLYMMLIGESTAMKKTTSLNYGMQTLREYTRESKERYFQEKVSYELSLKSKDKDANKFPKPVDESIIYPDDVTLEQLLVKMQDKPDGVFVLSELGAFLSRMDVSSGLKELLTTLYDAKVSYSRETKNSGCFHIKNPAPSLIGASTIHWLQNHLKDGDLLSGFLARFCYVVKRSHSEIDIPFQKPFELDPKWRKRFNAIRELNLELNRSEEAEHSFSEWYSEFKKTMLKEDAFLHSPLGRLKDDTIHKIAMINHVLDLLDPSFNRFIKDENTIEKRSYELAYPWIKFFADNAKSCYMEITQQFNFAEMKIIEIIKKRGKESEGFKTLARSEILKFSNMKLKDFEELAQTLVAKKQLLESKNGKYCHYKIRL